MTVVHELLMQPHLLKKYDMKHAFVFTLLLFCVACEKPDTPEAQSDIDLSLNYKNIQETGAYQIFYKPQNGFVGDPMPYYDADNQTFRIFFLYENGNTHPIYSVRTTNFAQFGNFAQTLACGSQGAQDEWIGTGSFVQKSSVYYCFYTGHNGNLNPAEKVMLATSSDMNNWTKQPSFLLEAPSGYDKNNFRDPCVYFDETRNAYVMLVTSIKNGKGAIVRYQSADLSEWAAIEPLLATSSDNPQIYEIQTDAEILECPDIFRMGNKWYLIFSRINRDVHRKTFYRIADNPNGPWKECGDRSQNQHHETFDGLYLYAAKTVSDGANRYVSGWASSGQAFNGSNELDWAGALITHKIVQQADGKLYPQIPDAVDALFSNSIEYKDIKKEGNVSGSGNSFNLSGGKVVFNRNIASVKIEMQIDASAATKNFGIAFGAYEDQQDSYAIKFDLTANNQYGLPALFMHHGSKEHNFTPLIVPQNKIFDVKIVIEKSVCVIYVNGNVAFTNRISNMNQNPWMIFADEGTVKFSAIKIFN
jgi:beta-fructofuranosidase